MELAVTLRQLLRRRRTLAIGVGLALIAAILSVYRLDGFSLKPRALTYASATTSVFIDTPSSVLGDVNQAIEPLQTRATAYANFMAGPTILNLIGQRAGIPGDQLYASGPVNPGLPQTIQEPTAVQANVATTGETTPYKLTFNNDPNLPTIEIYARAPTTKQATALANAAAASLVQYVSTVEQANRIPATARVAVRQLGGATGGVVNGGIRKSVAGMVFVAVLLAWCLLMVFAGRFRANWRASAKLAEPADPETSDASSNGKAPPQTEEAAAAWVSADAAHLHQS